MTTSIIVNSLADSPTDIVRICWRNKESTFSPFSTTCEAKDAQLEINEIEEMGMVVTKIERMPK